MTNNTQIEKIKEKFECLVASGSIFDSEGNDITDSMFGFFEKEIQENYVPRKVYIMNTQIEDIIKKFFEDRNEGTNNFGESVNGGYILDGEIKIEDLVQEISSYIQENYVPKEKDVIYVDVTSTDPAENKFISMKQVQENYVSKSYMKKIYIAGAEKVESRLGATTRDMFNIKEIQETIEWIKENINDDGLPVSINESSYLYFKNKTQEEGGTVCRLCGKGGLPHLGCSATINQEEGGK